jgi:hypothetical protein
MHESALATKPWRKHAAKRSNPALTLLFKEELDLLNWLTSTYYRGAGAIIDAGCFLGGSTVALASGLTENSVGGVIHSYDMFATGDKWPDVDFSRFGLAPNQNFEDRFRQNIAEYAQFVNVHAGNLLDESWPNEPVEILFLDICKLPEVHDHATRMWFPRLIPGRSIVIQQDYGWRYYHWGDVMMEVFKNHFEVLDEVAFGRVYLCTQRITNEEAASKLYSNLAPDEKLHHMQAALASASDPLWRANMLFSQVLLAESLGRRDVAREAVKQILTFSDSLASALGDPVGTTIGQFPHYFAGPDRLPLPERFRPTPQPPVIRRRLPLMSRVRREIGRLFRKKVG